MSPVAHWPMGPAGPRWVHQGDSGLYERYDPSIHADPSIFLDMCGVPFCSPGHVLSWDASLRPIRRCLCSRLIHRCSLNTPPEAGASHWLRRSRRFLFGRVMLARVNIVSIARSCQTRFFAIALSLLLEFFPFLYRRFRAFV